MTEYVRMRSRPGEGGSVPRRRHHEGNDGETPAALLFAFLVFFLVGFLSIWQLTSRDRAETMIEAGIVSATDIDRLLDDGFEDLQTFVKTSDEEIFAVPGFPLDVEVTADEVSRSTRDEFRALLLQRATAAVYENGAEAFDTDGNQSISRFSSEGALRLVVNGLTGDWHSLAQWAALVLAFLAAAIGLYVLRREVGHRRFIMLGSFTAGAGVMGCIVTFIVRALVGRFGGNDPFSNDLRDIADSALGVPMTNYTVIAISGVIVALIGVGLRAANQRFPTAPAGHDLDSGHYEYAGPDFGDTGRN